MNPPDSFQSCEFLTGQIRSILANRPDPTAPMSLYDLLCLLNKHGAPRNVLEDMSFIQYADDLELLPEQNAIRIRPLNILCLRNVSSDIDPEALKTLFDAPVVELRQRALKPSISAAINCGGHIWLLVFDSPAAARAACAFVRSPVFVKLMNSSQFDVRLFSTEMILQLPQLAGPYRKHLEMEQVQQQAQQQAAQLQAAQQQQAQQQQQQQQQQQGAARGVSPSQNTPAGSPVDPNAAPGDASFSPAPGSVGPPPAAGGSGRAEAFVAGVAVGGMRGDRKLQTPTTGPTDEERAAWVAKAEAARGKYRLTEENFKVVHALNPPDGTTKGFADAGRGRRVASALG
eukprot:TRINITY_DN1552_c0_g1_i3.p2 TRINITY_DN1552_c0_g1~~TRINITY_DN1552_c0_g1_i3.p2  ORF type:complete len:344 (+),score=67.59 TRINITY_DN1552_c0_g1_i3:176-1207(+)